MISIVVAPSSCCVTAPLWRCDAGSGSIHPIWFGAQHKQRERRGSADCVEKLAVALGAIATRSGWHSFRQRIESRLPAECPAQPSKTAAGALALWVHDSVANTNAEKRDIKEGRIPAEWANKPAKLAQKDRDARWTVKWSKANQPTTASPEGPWRCPPSATRTTSGSTAATA